MTEDQKWNDILRLYKKYLCEDSEEVKNYALSYNQDVSPEARRIHDEAIVIDTCAWNLQSWNWHLEHSGCTAINCTVPDCDSDAGTALRNIIEYYALCNEIDQCVMIRNVQDIYEAKRTERSALSLARRTATLFATRISTSLWKCLHVWACGSCPLPIITARLQLTAARLEAMTALPMTAEE